MAKLVAFFEIPVSDFGRAVKFYENLFGIEMEQMDCGHEKMALFPSEDGLCPGAVSWTSEMEFKPSDQGVLVSLSCESVSEALKVIKQNGGKILVPKTKIEAEGRGYFCIFLDSEGNRVGLHSDN